MTTFVQFFATNWPRWLSRKWGGRLRDSLALVADGLVQGVVDASLAKSPSRGPSDALPYSGLDRGLPQYPLETEPTYRARLRDPWTAYALAGTTPGIEAQFRAAGIATATVLENRFYAADGVNDANTWARFWILVPPGSGFSYVGHAWGDGWTWGDGTFWGGVTPASQLALIQTIVKQWQGAHCRFMGIIVTFSTNVWGYPGNAWGDGRVWGQGAAPIAVIPPT